MQVIVIDIGGTAIKYGIMDEHGGLMVHDQTPTEAKRGGQQLIEKVKYICDLLGREWDVSGIAISSAGQIDHDQGIVVHATDTIPGYTGMAIADQISNYTGLAVTVENDVNCTALGEHWKGAAKGYDDFICITIGTGIGGAVFANGKLYTGASFAAGEFGHMNLYKDGKACTCGGYGCYERYASSSALAEMVEDAFGKRLDLKHFFEMVRVEDPLSLQVFQNWVDDLATGIQSLVHIFNPELVVIGGGITAQGDLLVDAIQAALDPKIMPNHRKPLNLKLAEQDNKANLFGALKHFCQVHSSSL